MTRIRAIAIVLIVALSMPSAAPAQADLVTGLLTRARNALNDLKYSEADSIARLVVGLGDLVPRTARISALQIAAAARFPEEAGARRPDSALAALRAVVVLGHTDPIPFEVGWEGLDSLYKTVGGSPLQRGAPQAGVSAAASDPAGPSLEATAMWLTERVPQFATRLSWRDSSEAVVSTATETMSALNVTACVLKYRVLHQEEDNWTDGRTRKSSFKWDSAYTFDARSLDPATMQSGSADLTLQLFGVLRGTTRSQVGFLRVTEKKGRAAPRLLKWTFPQPTQASRVRNALERLVVLCQKEPF